MNKKLFVLFLLIFGFLFGCDNSSTDKEQFTLLYELDSTGNYYILNGYQGKNAPKEITVPSTYKQKPVEIIKNSAFYDCDDVEKILLPDSIREIQESAFSDCKNLKEINIPNQVEIIEEKTFYRCESLSIINMNEELKEIKPEAFFGCKKLFNIDLPNSVNIIGEKSFMLCEGLIYFNLPQKVRILEEQVFSGCKSLIDIKIENIEEIQEGAFLNCSNLKSIFISENIKSIENNVFSGCNSIEIMTLPYLGKTVDDEESQRLSYLFGDNEYIPNTIKEITLTKTQTLSDGAFENCESLEKIILPNTLTTLKDNVFKNCKQLKNLQIDSNIEYIGISCFKGCDSLPYYEENGMKYFGNKSNPYMVLIDITDKTLDTYYLNDQTLSIEKEAFRDCINAKDISIPNDLCKISYGLLKDCVLLEHISLPFLGEDILDEEQGLSYVFETSEKQKETLITVEIKQSTIASKNAFSDYKELTSIKYLKGIDKIKDQAFKGCRKLEKIELTDKVQVIPYEAFYGCETLKEVTLSDSIAEIEGYAFANCISLISINIPTNLTTINEFTFYNCASLKEIEIPNSVMTIGSSAFANCSSLLYAPIGNYTYIIGSYAFSNCISLQEIYINNNIAKLGYGVFQGCYNIEKIEVSKYNSFYDSRNNCNAIVSKENDEIISGCKNTLIDETIKIIGDRAFYKMPINQVTISKQIEKIGNNAFECCDKLTSVFFEEGGTLTYLGDYAFSSSAIKKICLPNTISHLGEGVFFNCYELESIVFEKEFNVKLIDNYMFADCVKLTSVNLPENTEIICNNVFGGCSSLNEINLPKNLKEIGSFAFMGCKSLETITIPNTVTKIGNYAFLSCKELLTINFPNELQYLGEGALYRCDSLQFNEYKNALYLGNSENPYLILIKAKNGFIDECEINENCSLIYFSAFDSCKNLKEIIIPRNVKVISGNIFNYIDEINIFVESPSPCDQYQESWNGNHKVYYYSETKPTEDGLYWHYENGEISIW